MRPCLPLILAVLPTLTAAQGIEDNVSESIYSCSRNQSLSFNVISRDPGRPWLAVLWVDGRLVTLENQGSMESPAWVQFNPDEGKGYDWRQKTEGEGELGWTGEDGKRQLVLLCNTSGEGGY